MIPGMYRGVGASRMRRGIGQAADDLSAFNNAIAAGDQYLAAGVTDGNVLGEFTSAVQAYQAGASAAATSLGPAIDTQTNGASRSLTQQAANVFNSQLSKVASTSSSQSDATTASLYAHQMQALYTTAIAIPPGGVTVPPVTQPAPAPTLAPTPTPSGGSSALPWVIGGAAVVAVGVAGWFLLRRTPGRRLLPA
jgi:uncharacterized phage infection (PIP) family protein YhgE